MMVKLFDQSFIESYCNDYFDEFISNSTMFLKNKNSEYQRLLDKKHKILKKCPNLEEILDNGTRIALSKYEAKYIREYELVMIDLTIMEEKEMFLRGMREAYYLFKKMNLIK